MDDGDRSSPQRLKIHSKVKLASFWQEFWGDGFSSGGILVALS
jgi:hypothetical protein